MDIRAYIELTEQLYHLICEYGIKHVGRPGADGPSFYEFQVAVHEGWKKAQLQILGALQAIDREIVLNEDEYRSARQSKDNRSKQATIETRAVLAYQRNGVIFAQNAIVWTMFGLKTWMVRRFYLDEGINNASSDSLARVFRHVNDINKQDNKLAIACDLTTFMHVGDVIQVELAPDGARRVTIVELKEGGKNEELLNFLLALEEIPCPRAAAFKIDELPKKDKDHVFRLMKQHWRMDNVAKAVNEGRAKDIGSGNDLRIPDKEYLIDNYDSRIAALYEKLDAGTPWAIDVVEDCVFLGIYRPPQMSVAFDPWLKLVKFSGLKVDFATQSNSPLARPLLTLPWPRELVLGLLKREIILLVALDIPKWMESVNKRWPGFLRYETRGKSKTVPHKNGDLLEHDHRLILGGPGDRKAYVGTGIVGKILFEFYSPTGVFLPWQDDLDHESPDDQQS
jgi:hypothetical protein